MAEWVRVSEWVRLDGVEEGERVWRRWKMVMAKERV
jgi:hypothetical protein